MRFRTIDGLRGIAAMAVVFFHLNGATRVTWGDRLPAAIDWLFQQGHYGVDVFFVLSGFVIAYSTRHADATLGYLGRFALRRSVRLDPPYWTAIFLEIVVQAAALRLGFSEVPLPSWPQVLAHFVYLQNLLGLGNVVDVFWTLCFEIQFYLALIAMLVVKRRLEAWIGAGPAGAVGAAFLVGAFAYSLTVRFELFGWTAVPGLATIRWYQFFMGACVWWVVSGRAHRLVLPATFGALAATVVAAGATPLELLPIAICCLIWWSYERDGMATALSGRTLQFLGLVSYSLYLFHATVGWRLIRLAGVVLGDSPPIAMVVASFAAGIAACVAVAWIGWRVLEAPSIRLSKRIALPTRARPPAPVAAEASA